MSEKRDLSENLKPKIVREDKALARYFSPENQKPPIAVEKQAKITGAKAGKITLCKQC